jgi:stage II sporulation protein D
LRWAIAAAYLSRRRPSPLGRARHVILAAVLAALTIASAGAGIARAASTFTIRGGGNGHGIGMSQYGAEGYARHGRNYRWILAHYYRGTALGTVARGRTVRVLLADGAATLSGASTIGARRVKPARAYAIRPNADGTLVLVAPSGKKLGTFAAPLRAAGPGPLALAGVGSYRGKLEFRPDGHGGVETIDVVGLDDYVRGVISAEMPATWAPEALRVQAVAARTYALTSDAGGSVFELYADTRSQMYRGVAAETAATDAAVAATRRQIVTYAGQTAITYFSSSSGGHTENIENVWPGARPEPWLRGVVDRYDAAAGNPYHRWSRRMTLAAASARLGSLVRGRLTGITVVRHGSSPRILLARVAGTRGSRTATGLQLQRAFALPTTYASFTTVSTRAAGGANRPEPGSALSVGLPRSPAALSLLPLVDALTGGSGRAIAGSVVPASPHERVSVQRWRGGRWRTVDSARLGAAGRFDIGVRARGRYRVLCRGVPGPAVRVG